MAGLGLVEDELLGSGGGSDDSAASYSSFHDTDSDFSTISSTRGLSGPVLEDRVSSNQLCVRGADTGLPPRVNLGGNDAWSLGLPSQ